MLFVCAVEAKADKVWIPSWQATSEMTIERAGAAYVTYGNYIYALGGVDGKVFLDSIERAEIKKDGSLGAWQIVSQLPEPRGFFSAVVYNNRVYAIGGGNGPYGKNLLNTIVNAEIRPDGSLGNWRTESNVMLVPRRCVKIFVHGNTLYAAGGFGGALLDTVEFATLNTRGELSEWTLSSEKLTTPRYVNELKKIGHRVFAIGGHHQSSGKGINSVEYFDLATKGMWQKSVDLKQGRYAFSAVVIRDNIFVMGGLSGAEYLDSIEGSTSNELIRGANWRQVESLPERMANFSSLAVGDRIYIFGGSTRSRYLRKVWFAEVNNKGEIGYFGDPADFDKIQQRKHEMDEDGLPNKGQVLKVINSSDYTYMLIATENGDGWLAAPRNNIPVGANVKFSEGVYMSNFYSKTLDMKFESILFVGTVKQN